jgi:hypothetical protein
MRKLGGLRNTALLELRHPGGRDHPFDHDAGHLPVSRIQRHESAPSNGASEAFDESFMRVPQFFRINLAF